MSLTIGLTGGIATGKSSVLKIINKLGYIQRVKNNVKRG